MTGLPPSERAQQIAALQAALAAEQAASYGYGVAGGNLTGAQLAAATAGWTEHQRARDALTAQIIALGAQPHPAAVAYQLPVAVTGPSTAIKLAARLEMQVAAGYLGLVGLTDQALRRFGAEQMQAAAVRAAKWSGQSVAFPGLTHA